MKTRVFRGISVDPASRVDDVIQELQAGNLNAPDRNLAGYDLRPYFEAILADPALRQTIDPPIRPITFVCGDIAGAAHYATRDKGTPLVAELSVDISALSVDCRDFLCTAFQFGVEGEPAVIEGRARTLERLFGSAVVKYFEGAAREPEHEGRIALCNAVTFDPEVVAGHLKNTEVIEGRYGVRFRSAFVLRLPVAADALVAIHRTGLRDLAEEPTVTLDDIRSR